MIGLDLTSPLMEHAFAELAVHHVVYDPTLALMEQYDYPIDELRRREPGLAKIPPALRGNFTGVEAEDATDADLEFKKYLAVVRELHRRGIPIVAGTDVGVPGHSLHRELELYVEAGFTPLEAIQSATSVAARVMGRSDLGTIAAGKRADLIVVAGDPLADVRALRQVQLVVSRGLRYRPAPLWTLAGFTP